MYLAPETYAVAITKHRPNELVKKQRTASYSPKGVNHENEELAKWSSGSTAVDDISVSGDGSDVIECPRHD